jgi:hypothetical protein
VKHEAKDSHFLKGKGDVLPVNPYYYYHLYHQAKRENRRLAALMAVTVLVDRPHCTAAVKRLPLGIKPEVMKSVTTLPHYRLGRSQPYTGLLAWKQLAGWSLALIAVAIGYSYAAPLIGPVLEKLYELLIQKNVLGL